MPLLELLNILDGEITLGNLLDLIESGIQVGYIGNNH